MTQVLPSSCPLILVEITIILKDHIPNDEKKTANPHHDYAWSKNHWKLFGEKTHQPRKKGTCCLAI